jgi:hypothetical protein
VGLLNPLLLEAISWQEPFSDNDLVIDVLQRVEHPVMLYHDGVLVLERGRFGGIALLGRHI